MGRFVTTVCVEIARKFDALKLEGKRKYTCCIYIQGLYTAERNS